jgi:hypothetical protein
MVGLYSIGKIARAQHKSYINRTLDTTTTTTTTTTTPT